MQKANAQNFIYLLPASNSEVELAAYVKPSEKTREWFAPHFYHCLPLVVANTLGWTVYNLYEFSVSWDGHDHPDSVIVKTSAAS